MWWLRITRCCPKTRGKVESTSLTTSVPRTEVKDLAESVLNSFMRFLVGDLRVWKQCEACYSFEVVGSNLKHHVELRRAADESLTKTPKVATLKALSGLGTQPCGGFARDWTAPVTQRLVRILPGASVLTGVRLWLQWTHEKRHDLKPVYTHSDQSKWSTGCSYRKSDRGEPSAPTSAAEFKRIPLLALSLWNKWCHHGMTSTLLADPIRPESCFQLVKE